MAQVVFRMAIERISHFLISNPSKQKIMNIYLMIGLIVFGFVLGIKLLGGIIRLFFPFYFPFASPHMMSATPASIPASTPSENNESVRIILSLAVAGLILLLLAIHRYSIRITFENKDASGWLYQDQEASKAHAEATFVAEKTK